MRGNVVVCCESRAKAVPYVEALRAVAAPAERLQVVTPEEPAHDLEWLAANSAGVLLCGGPDMEPWRYGQEPLAGARLSLLPGLDQVEWDLLVGSAAARTPVWAVCRGLQTVNVFLGGTLWQDIPSQLGVAVDHDVPEPRQALAHRVAGDPHDDPWAGLLTAGPVPVNSRHHQAIRDLGAGVSPVAQSPDGLIEAAIVDRRGWWVKGVQWHPEDLVHLPLHRRLWSEFLRAAGIGRDGDLGAPADA